MFGHPYFDKLCKVRIFGNKKVEFLSKFDATSKMQCPNLNELRIKQDQTKVSPTQNIIELNIFVKQRSISH